ncbi:MAG: hypothetical protein JHC84_00440 [Solirubrobacteraceae bacterium]|nr:hypothetical protein [Solirubrobacteraceae bacterium]
MTLVDALTTERWARANRELIAKVLTEFVYEDMLAPERDGDDCTLVLPDGRVLRWTAARRILGHWRADPASVRLTDTDGADLPLLDADALTALLAPVIGADATTTAGLVGEVAQTLLADVVQLRDGRPVAHLLDADAAQLEGELRGHPWICANKGRIGFDADDLATFAPEAQRPMRLPWLAVDPARADTRQVGGLTHHDVVREQVGDLGFDALRERAAAGGLDPGTAVYLPVHPWQWREKIVALHAGDLARGTIVPLGEAPPRYLPQQSIRTFADVTDPSRRFLKLPISILNTSVYRGLPRERALAAPALTSWFRRCCESDPFLREAGLRLLGEVASVSVAHPGFASIDGVPYQHTEMLGAIWRDPVAPLLADGERAISLAALLHRDPAGDGFAAALITRSGLSAADWVARLHEVTLPPLLHVLYRYGATFSPHAQNCLLVLRDDVPCGLIVKDFVDDAIVSAERLPEHEDMPADVRAALGDGVEADVIVQWIQSGLLVCVHRFLSELLLEDLGLAEEEFWALAEHAVRSYQDRFEDELGDRYELFPIDAPAFVKLCLNRVRVLGRGYADDAERPIASASGWLENPLAWNDSPGGSPFHCENSPEAPSRGLVPTHD